MMFFVSAAVAKSEEEGSLNSGDELKPITKCFSLLEVSTNKCNADR